MTSIYGLFKDMGYEKYYDSIYGGLSMETHGLNSSMGVDVTDAGIFIKWIRNPVECESAFSIACSFALGALKQIQDYLGQDENEIRKSKSFFEEFMNRRDRVIGNLQLIRISS